MSGDMTVCTSSLSFAVNHSVPSPCLQSSFSEPLVGTFTMLGPGNAQGMTVQVHPFTCLLLDPVELPALLLNHLLSSVETDDCPLWLRVALAMEMAIVSLEFSTRAWRPRLLRATLRDKDSLLCGVSTKSPSLALMHGCSDWKESLGKELWLHTTA